METLKKKGLFEIYLIVVYRYGLFYHQIEALEMELLVQGLKKSLRQSWSHKRSSFCTFVWEL